MMSEAQFGLGERFVDDMTRLAAGGNPLAAAAVLEVLAADDRDAKAAELVDRLAEQMKPVIEAFQRVGDAIAAAFGPDWVDRVNEITGRSTVDQEPFDLEPDDCWRCDAAEASTDVGLCGSCRDDLLIASRSGE